MLLLFYKQGSPSDVVLAFYISRTKFACMHRLNLAAKKKQGKKSWLRLCFDQIHKKLDYSKRFTDDIGKKINDDFKKKQKVSGHGSFTVSQELEFDPPHKLHYLFHATLIEL